MKLRKFLQVRLLIMVLMMGSHFLSGQDKLLIDSLQLSLKTAKLDTSKILILLKIAKHYSSFDLEESKKYLNKAKEVALRLGDQEINAEIFFMEGSIYFNSAEYKLARENFNKALALYIKLKNKPKIAFTCLKIGNVYNEEMNLNKAIEYYTKAEFFFKKLNDRDNMGYCYEMFGTIYMSQQKYNKALDYFDMAIKLTNKNNQLRLAHIKSNILNTYCSLNDFKKAASYIDSIVSVLEEEKDYYLLNNVYTNGSVIYTNLKEFDKAKACIEKSKYYAVKMDNPYYIMNANMSLAYFYGEVNMLDSAIKIYNYCLEENRILKISDINNVIFNNLAITYEKKGNAELAYKYLEKYVTVNDSITKDYNSKKLFEIQTQYEVNLKNEQIKLLTKNEQLARQKVMTLGISLLTVVIASFLFISYKNRKAKEKKLIHESELKESAYKHEAELKEAAYKIEVKQRELILNAMHLSQQEKNLSYIKKQLENISAENSKTKETILSLLSGINQQLKQNTMEDFERYFIEVHPEFFTNLKQKYNNLTQNDLKICALIKLNLNIKQIADITRKTTRSVENSRSMIRKKIGLSIEENLFEAISQY